MVYTTAEWRHNNTHTYTRSPCNVYVWCEFVSCSWTRKLPNAFEATSQYYPSCVPFVIVRTGLKTRLLPKFCANAGLCECVECNTVRPTVGAKVWIPFWMTPVQCPDSSALHQDCQRLSPLSPISPCLIEQDEDLKNRKVSAAGSLSKRSTKTNIAYPTSAGSYGPLFNFQF